MEKTLSRREGFIKRNWGMIYSLIALITDALSLNFALIASIWMRFDNLNNLKYYTKALIFVNLMFIFLSLGLGVFRSRYNLSRDNLRYYYKRLTVYIAVSTMAFLYIIRGQEYSRYVIFVMFFIFYVLLEIVHGLILKLQHHLVRKKIIGFNTIIIGADHWTYTFSQRISHVFGGFFHIMGYLHNTIEGESQTQKELERHIIGSLGQLNELLDKQNPDVVFIVSNDMDLEKYAGIYQACKQRNVKLKVISPRVSDIFSNSRIRDVFGVSLVLETWRIHFQRFNARLKRIFDIVFIILISPVLFPLVLLISLGVKLTSRGAVFFKQKRSLCKGGKEFFFYKFRSMYHNAEQMKDLLMERNESDGALFKIKKDPRVTPFGRFIRKFSLDELPQFINVLKGEMSIVGPRPLPVKDFDLMEKDGLDINTEWHRHRGSVKPGITGLWQISGRSNLSFEEMLFLDLYYIEHQSIFFDLEILFETFPAVFLGRGAY